MILFFSLVILFLVSPILCGFVSVILLFTYKNNYKCQAICLFFLSLLLGVLNSLKVPESDLLNYVTLFELVPDFNFYTYLVISGKEFVFNLLNYPLYYLTAGSFPIYLGIFTSVSYFILFYSILKMHKAVKLSNSAFLMSMGVAFLFPQLFSLSGHLLRQFLAGSLTCLFLVDYFFYNKKGYFIILSAILIHTSSILFIIVITPFFRFNFFSLKNLKYTFSYGILFLLLFYLTSKFEIPVLSYLIERASTTTKNDQFSSLSLVNFLLLGFNVGVTYLASLKMNMKANRSSIHSLFIINLVLLLFVLINFNNVEIALRFSFYGHFLFPITFYYVMNVFFSSRLNEINLILMLFILFLFLFFFLFKIFYGYWTYNNLEKIIFLWNIN